MKDLRVELKIKNNLLYSAIMSKYRSVAHFCRVKKLDDVAVGCYLNFKRSPLTRSKKYGQAKIDDVFYIKKSAIAIADALEVTFFDIFPPSSYEPKKNKFATEIDSCDFLPFNDNNPPPLLAEPHVEPKDVHAALQLLPARDRGVLIDRFGFFGNPMTLEACAEKLQVSRERVRQIEAKAIRRLRTHFLRNPLLS